MLWNWTTIDACYLSSNWHIKTEGMFAVSCIGVFLLVISMEFLRRLSKEYDSYIHRQFLAFVTKQGESNQSTGISLLGSSGVDGPLSTDSTSTPAGPQKGISPGLLGRRQTVLKFRPSPLQQFIRSTIHMLQFGVAYIIMLLAMYFNGYIIISIILGGFAGKFLCDWGVNTIVLGDDEDGYGPKGAMTDEVTCCCG